MQCRNCGTEISDKALICYRCGEPTTAPRVQPPPPPKVRGVTPLILTMLVLIAIAAIGLPFTTPGPERMAGWTTFVIAVAIAVWRLRPTPRRRKR